MFGLHQALFLLKLIRGFEIILLYFYIYNLSSQNSYLKSGRQSKFNLLFRKQHPWVCEINNQTPKIPNFFKLVVQCSTYNWLYEVMLHKAIKFKNCFWALTASGFLPTSSESFTVIHWKESVAGVLLLA